MKLPKLSERQRLLAFIGVWLDFAALYVSTIVLADPLLAGIALTVLLALGVAALLA